MNYTLGGFTDATITASAGPEAGLAAEWSF